MTDTHAAGDVLAPSPGFADARRPIVRAAAPENAALLGVGKVEPPVAAERVDVLNFAARVEHDHRAINARGREAVGARSG